MFIAKRLCSLVSVVVLLLMSFGASADDSERRAVMVPDAGTYSRTIATDVPEAQQFFDQGLRLAWGFYFPESIASYQEASRLDPGNPMP